MKKCLTLFALVVASPVLLMAFEQNAGCFCCQGKEVCSFDTAAAKADPAKRHPLRGVIISVHAPESALTVKHEEVPGVMRAMTMVFKVEPETLKRVQKGQTITAQMSRENNTWWLHDVKVVGTPGS